VSRRDEIITRVNEVRGLPASTLDALRMLNDPGFRIADLAKAIEFDPGMTGNVLRLANSSYFGASREICTVRDAITRLGLRNLFNVMVTSAAAPLFQQAIAGYDIPAGKLWAQSVATAVGTDKLCACLRRPAHELGFTTGLLLDIGKLVLGSFLEVDGEDILDLVNREGVAFDAAEREILGIDHAEVGAVLLGRWQLPLAIVDTVRWHHRPDLAVGGNLLLDLVHLADRLGHVSGVGLGLDMGRYHYAESSFERLGYGQEMDEGVLEQIGEAIGELDGAFAGAGQHA
jgi:HD-like signal output (HDOD) protein